MIRSPLLLQSLRRTRTLVLVAAGLVGSSGCTSHPYRPQPIAAEKTAKAFDTRSLSAPELQRFLRENLGRDPTPPPGASWDFETLAWVSFYYNPNLDVARAQWESARAVVKSAGARPNPTLSLTPGYSTNPGAGVSPWFPGLTFDFPIETAGKRDRRAEAAAQTAEAARQSLFTAAWKVRSDLRHALLDLAAATARLERLRAQAAIQERTVALLERRLAAGSIAATEIGTSRLASVRSAATVAEAERQLPLARQRVATALGLPVAALEGTSLAAPAPLAPFSPSQLTVARRQSLETRADVLAALARYSASEAALALEIARQYPDLHLSPGYQWDQGQNKWSIGFTFELPVFHRNEGPIAVAEAQRREAAAQFLATQAQVLAEIDAAVTAQIAAAAQLDRVRQLQIQLGEQRARVAKRQQAGAADQLEAESAELEFETGKLALIDAEAQAALATGQLEDALQIPFAHLASLEKSPATAASSSPP